MIADSNTGTVRIARWHAALLLAATVLTYLLITLGGVVCITGSAAGCPDWPGCYGRIVPPPQVNAIIEYLHRFVAALTSPLILAAAIVSWWKARPIRWVSRPPTIAIPFLLAVIVFPFGGCSRGIDNLVDALLELGEVERAVVYG